MKITRLEPIQAHAWRWVRIHTDEGLTGIGELHGGSGGSGTPHAVIAAVKYLEEYLIDKDPLPIEMLWQHMFRRQLFRGGADTMAALGAIDCALWDIKGKAAEVPVHSLLGGVTRKRIRLYVHVLGETATELAEDATRRVEEGYTAVRFYPLGGFNGDEFGKAGYSGIASMVESRVAAVRATVGPDIDVMIDVVNRLTPS